MSQILADGQGCRGGDMGKGRNWERKKTSGKRHVQVVEWER